MCISLKSHVIAPRSIVARLLADSLFCETQLLPLLREFCFSFPLLLQEKKKIQCHRGAHFISASVRKNFLLFPPTSFTLGQNKTALSITARSVGMKQLCMVSR